MAHDCPECGQTCFCGGDIDDCNWGDSDIGGWATCTHCPYDSDPDDEYEPFEEPN